MIVDAVVVGGGPAGLAAAIALSEAGVEVVVCERGEYPQDKACGEGIQPAGVWALERLGVLPLLGPGAARPITGVCYRAPNGVEARASFAEGPGLGVRRTVLSEALRRRATHLHGVQLRARCSVDRLGWEADLVAVHTAGGTLRTRLLVGADGLGSQVRRWCRLDGGLGRYRRWGVRQHFLTPPGDEVEIWWGPQAEVYLTPVAADVTGVAVLWNALAPKPKPSGARVLFELLARFPALHARFSGAEAVSDRRAVGPLERRARGAVAPGVVLIGDARGYVDAITGEGLSAAFAEATLLAELLAPALLRARREGGTVPLRTLRTFAARAHRLTRGHRWVTRALLAASARPWLVPALIGALSTRPRVLQALLSLNMGTLRPANAPWALAADAALSAARHRYRLTTR